MELINKKPCLIETSQGFCVEYQNKLLYSKYNPSKNIVKVVSELDILPGTLIIACSPLLCYGIKELAERLPEDCLILGVEAEPELLEFSREYIQKNQEKFKDKFVFAEKEDLYSIHELLQKKHSKLKNGFVLPECGTLKRAIKIDFSAGTSFCKEFYDSLTQVAQNSIAQFFKNRVTLTKFGRRFSHNIFRNLTKISETIDFSSVKKSVSRSIIILGTGKSVLNTLYRIKNSREIFFLIALDATLHLLKSFDIKADAVVCEESQSIIAKMFTGSIKNSSLTLCGLTSCPETSSKASDKTAFFLPEYTDADFFIDLKQKNLLPELIKPLGSVGLTAVLMALYLRKSADVKVYVSGLDFSYEKSLSHANGSIVHKNALISSSKVKPVQNPGLYFSNGTFTFSDFTGKEMISTKNLSGYAEIFKIFQNEPNIFDIRDRGIDLGLQNGFNLLKNEIEKPAALKNAFDFELKNRQDEEKKKINLRVKEYFETEIQALEKAKAILTGKIKMASDDAAVQLTEILKSRDYLYLHFPDGHRFSLEIQFLKRVRTEIDFYLKEFNTDLSVINLN